MVTDLWWGINACRYCLKEREIKPMAICILWAHNLSLSLPRVYDEIEMFRCDL